MRKHNWLVFDLSSVLKKCYFAGKDKEFGFEVDFNGKKVWINGWQHGREYFMNSVSATLRELNATPMDCIFVLEGENGASTRRNIFPGYKKRGERPVEQLEQYQKVEDWVVQYFKRLGSVFVQQDGLEADDVVAYLSKNLKGVRHVIMDDGDGLILHNGEDVFVRYQGQPFKPEINPMGPFDVSFNRIYKAIVGDSSDTLPGAGGVGKGGFMDVFTFIEEDGMAALELAIDKGDWNTVIADIKTLMDSGDKGFNKVGKVLQKIVDDRDVVRRCLKCVSFFDHMVSTPTRPPLKWQVGMTVEKPADEHADDRFDQWYQQRRLVTAKNFSQIMASQIWAQIRESRYVSLDLETTTPPESDEWLRQVNRQDEDADPIGVDVIASTITGMGLTFGDNNQFTLYFSVDHADTDNITIKQLYEFLAKLVDCDPEISYTVHNSAFELPVLFNNLVEWSGENDNWDCGFLPRVEDSLFMASYVDENKRLGLKAQALDVLGYAQTSYDETVTLQHEDGTSTKRKMHELSAREVFAYGTDDTIVTAALRNYYEIVMQIEDTWRIYADIEMHAAYLAAAGFVNGVEFDRERMSQQSYEDDKVYDANWKIVREYLVEKDWDGVTMPEVTLEPASIKEVWKLVTGLDLETRARTPSKIVAAMPDDTAAGAELKALYEVAVGRGNGDMQYVTQLAQQHFAGEPDLNTDSPKQMNRLVYEVMGLPIRVRNKPTPTMKAAGEKGSPKTDSLAIATAKYYDSAEFPEAIAVLDALHKMKGVATRRKLFYRPYSTLVHWKTGRIHGSAGQLMTATRRFAPNKPNLAQLPVDQKKGDFRANFKPHHKNAVVLSFDFNAQELRLIADSSQDPAMLSCYVGDNLRDMHHLTALKIVQSEVSPDITYESFVNVYDDEGNPAHKTYVAARKKAKTTNFASEYGAMGPKMAETLMVPLEVAEAYIAAKHETFWRAEEWKKHEVIPRARKVGYASTRLGARRHLAEAFRSDDWSISSRAERQAVNFEIQGSCGEQTRLAMKKIWVRRLLMNYDVAFMFVVHDELVVSCGREDVMTVVPIIHGIMEEQYADMQVPCKSSIGLGHNFRHLIEIGMEPKPELIAGAMKKLFPGWEFESDQVTETT